MFLGKVLTVSGAVFGMAMTLAGVAQQTPFMLSVGAASFAMGVYLCTKLFFVRVVEHETLVVQNHVTGEFSRWLGPGLHLLGFYEISDFRFKTFPVVIEKEIGGLRSAEGIPHKATYTILVEPSLNTISSEDLASKVHIVAFKFQKEAHAISEQSLRHVMGKLTAIELSQGNALQMLERHFRADIEKRLQRVGIKVKRVSIGAVSPPALFKKSLIESKTRLMEAIPSPKFDKKEQFVK